MRLRGATYNLKYASVDGPHAWPERRALVAQTLRLVGADVVGTQEGHYGQLREIAADTGYAWIGEGRRGGSRGEFAAVLYDPARVEPRAYGHFWLSATPEVIGSVSRSWGNEVVRMATWVRFRLEERELLWLNTHLDHRSEPSRRRAARLIASRLGEIAPDLPTVVSGDFNCAAGSSAAYAILAEAGLRDTWAEGDGPDVATHGGWGAPQPGGDRIDWLLVRGPIEVERARISDHHVGEQWPSDHVPVWADLALTAH